jgi:hypothetical protein
VTLTTPPDGVGTHRVYLRLPRAAVQGETIAVTFRLTDTASGRSRPSRRSTRGRSGPTRDEREGAGGVGAFGLA